MPCPCGRAHVPSTPDILIGPGVLDALAGLVAKNATNGKIFLVSDENCYAAAGEKVLSALGGPPAGSGPNPGGPSAGSGANCGGQPSGSSANCGGPPAGSCPNFDIRELILSGETHESATDAGEAFSGETGETQAGETGICEAEMRKTGRGGPGASDALPGEVRAGETNPGEAISGEASGNGGFADKFIFFGLLPDERALGRIFAECPPDAGLILAVGSGTVNDLSRFAASRLKIPYIVVATAPSMDGYASGVSALLINGFKSTYDAVAPAAIIGDADVLSGAPEIMKSAGFGDVIGKYTSLSDWRLGALIFGEYHCRYIEGLVERAVEKCAANPHDAAALMEGLCLSGTAMSYAGSSRPASGAEHHLSHFWEMRFTAGRRYDPPHGIKVGVASLAMIRLREMLREEEPKVFDRAREKARRFDFAAYGRKISEIYGQNAARIIAAEAAERDPENVLRRIGLYEEKWPEILEECGGAPPFEYVRELLKTAGAPVRPQDLGVTRGEFIDGIIHAMVIRPRFTILRLLADMGILEPYAQALAAEFGY